MGSYGPDDYQGALKAGNEWDPSAPGGHLLTGRE